MPRVLSAILGFMLLLGFGGTDKQDQPIVRSQCKLYSLDAGHIHDGLDRYAAVLQFDPEPICVIDSLLVGNFATTLMPEPGLDGSSPLVDLVFAGYRLELRPVSSNTHSYPP